MDRPQRVRVPRWRHGTCQSKGGTGEMAVAGRRLYHQSQGSVVSLRLEEVASLCYMDASLSRASGRAFVQGCGHWESSTEGQSACGGITSGR